MTLLLAPPPAPAAPPHRTPHTAPSAAPRARVAHAAPGPRFFGPQGASLYGWYHAPAAGRARREAVVLAPSAGPEYMTGHRTLRVLAERLAADGFGVLRFDWPGTGDSAGGAGPLGSPDPALSLAAWRRALGEAAAHARAAAGARRVTVVGLRAGALVALDAVAAGGVPGVDRLVLWWPPASGRQFLRELRARAGFGGLVEDGASAAAGDGLDVPGMLESEGFVLPPDLVAEVGALRLDAAAAARRGVEVVLAPAAEGARPDAADAGVTTVRLPGAECMRGTAQLTVIPVEAVGTLAGVLATAADRAPGPRTPPTAGAGSPGAGASPARRSAVVDGAREHLVRVGPGLAGVLTEPDGPDHPTAPPVLLLHSGADHRVGPARYWTAWARRWAALGVTTLRFDPHGFGDSPLDAPLLGGPPGAPRDEGAIAPPYADHHAADALAAADFLCAHTGHRAVAYVGICSGGYYALQAAAADPARAARVVAVNPQLYYGREAFDPGAIEAYRVTSAARDPRRWLRLLRGQASPRLAARMASAAAARAARAGLARWRPARGAGPAAGTAAALADFPRLAAGGVVPHLILARSDEAWHYLHEQVAGAWAACRRRHPTRVTMVEHAQHTFGRPWMQRRLFALVTADLMLGAAPGPSRDG